MIMVLQQKDKLNVFDLVLSWTLFMDFMASLCKGHSVKRVRGLFSVNNLVQIMEINSLIKDVTFRKISFYVVNVFSICEVTIVLWKK